MTALRVLALPAAAAMFLTGCANERHHEIPPSAQMTVEGNKELSFTTPHDGRIYVYDVDEDRMVYQGMVEQGGIVSVDPDRDRVTVNGGTVAEKDAFDVGHQHRIFFKQEDLPETLVVPAGARVEVDPQPAPDTKMEIKEADQPDTRIEIDSDDADTEIKVD